MGRCTSADMAEGRGGWNGKFVSFYNAPACALVFFTFKPSRVNGHVGILILKTKDMENQVANASQSHNRFIQTKMKKGGDDGFYEHLSHTKELN